MSGMAKTKIAYDAVAEVLDSVGTCTFNLSEFFHPSLHSRSQMGFDSAGVNCFLEIKSLFFHQSGTMDAGVVVLFFDRIFYLAGRKHRHVFRRMEIHQSARWLADSKLSEGDCMVVDVDCELYHCGAVEVCEVTAGIAQKSNLNISFGSMQRLGPFGITLLSKL